MSMRRLLDAANATGAGSSTKIVAGLVRVAEKHTVSIVWTDTSGSITAMTVDLEGSIDGTNFFQLASNVVTAAGLTAKKEMFHVKQRPVSYVKANITTLTETGDHLIYVDYEPYDPK